MSEPKVFRYLLLDSTQEEAKRLFLKGEELPFFVIAEKQSKGRGRLGRRWVSEEGGVWLTYAFKPDKQVNLLISNYAASLIVKGIIEELGADCSVKWPNDLFVKGAKVCGIISDAEYYGNEPVLVALGIGLNVENDISMIDARYPVTSLKDVLKRDIDRNEIATQIVRRITDRFTNMDRDEVMKEYLHALDIMGKRVKIKVDDYYVEGIAEGIDEEGLLIINVGEKKVHLADGELQQL